MYEDRRFDILAVKEGNNNEQISARYKNVKLLKAERDYVEFEDDYGNIHIITGALAIFVDEADQVENSEEFK